MIIQRLRTLQLQAEKRQVDSQQIGYQTTLFAKTMCLNQPLRLADMKTLITRLDCQDDWSHFKNVTKTEAVPSSEFFFHEQSTEHFVCFFPFEFELSK